MTEEWCGPSVPSCLSLICSEKTSKKKKRILVREWIRMQGQQVEGDTLQRLKSLCVCPYVLIETILLTVRLQTTNADDGRGEEERGRKQCLVSPSVACCLAPCLVPGLIFRLSPISIITPTPHFPVPAFPSKTELQGVTVKISPYEMRQNIQDPHRSSLVVGWVYVKRPDRTFPVRSLQLWWIWILNAIYHLFNGDRKVWSPVIHP